MDRVVRRGAIGGPLLAMFLLGAVLSGTAGAAPPAPLSCGAVITASTKLANDVGPCTTDGLIIAGDRVKLDLNGHRVFGAPAADTQGGAAGQNAGVRFRDVSNSEVRNGEVTGFSVGVRIDRGGGNRVTEIYAHDNIGPVGTTLNGDGISVWNSSNNVVDRNLVVHNGPYSGIAVATGLYSSPNDTPITVTGNKMRDNTVLNNNVDLCRRSTGCTTRDPDTGQVIQGLTVPLGQQISGSQDEGIRVEGPNATYTEVERNVIRDSGDNGIMLSNSCHGAFLAPGRPNCTGNVGNIGTLIKDNQTDHNGYGRGVGSGIHLFAMGFGTTAPDRTTIVGNTARLNMRDGIVVTSVCGTPGSDMAGEGCVSAYNAILRNNASDNGRHGIVLGPLSHDNRVNQNTVNNNGNRCTAPSTTLCGVGIALLVANSGNPPAPVTGTGPYNNILFSNQGRGNTAFDGADETPGCDNNDWENNDFVTVNQPCVLDSGTRPERRQPGNGYGSGVGNRNDVDDGSAQDRSRRNGDNT